MNEELEQEMIQKDEILIKVKKEFETKNKRLNAVEEEFEIEELTNWQKKKQISESLIKTLEAENTSLRNKLEIEKGNSDCIENLIKEINVLKDTNKEKEIQIVKVEKVTNHILIQNLINMKKKKMLFE